MHNAAVCSAERTLKRRTAGQWCGCLDAQINDRPGTLNLALVEENQPPHRPAGIPASPARSGLVTAGAILATLGAKTRRLDIVGVFCISNATAMFTANDSRTVG